LMLIPTRDEAATAQRHDEGAVRVQAARVSPVPRILMSILVFAAFVVGLVYVVGNNGIGLNLRTAVVVQMAVFALFTPFVLARLDRCIGETREFLRRRRLTEDTAVSEACK
jgi:hypothetical protein